MHRHVIGKAQFACAGLVAAVTAILLSGAGPTARAAEPIAPSSQPTGYTAADADGALPFRGSIDRFIDQLGAGAFDAAIDALHLEAGFEEGKRTALRRRLSTLYRVVGKPRGHEVVALSIVSPSLARASVLAHYNGGVVPFHLTYWHRPGDRADDWRTVGCTVVTDVDEVCKLLPPTPYHDPMHTPPPTTEPGGGRPVSRPQMGIGKTRLATAEVGVRCGVPEAIGRTTTSV